MEIEVKDNNLINIKNGNLQDLCRGLKDGTYQVKIVKPKRNNQQNALLWLWLTCAENELGASKEQLYSYMCNKFLVSELTFKNGVVHKVSTSSSKLNKKDFSEFLNKIQICLSVEFGIKVPLPEDLGYDEFLKTYG